jgi:uncharacterized delta-60 repeat protein
MRYRRSTPTVRAICERLDRRTMLAAGQLDLGFGGDGIVTVPDVAVFFDIAVQADGRVVAVGEGANLWRFLPDGTPDPAFGAGGKADIALGAGASLGRLELLDGRMLVGGSVLARVTADGHLDRNFGGGDGIVPVGAGGIAVQPDGNIVTTDGIAVYRFTPDGVLDTTFGNGGRVTFNYPIGRVVNRTDPEYPDRYDDFVPKDVAWQSTSGRILVGGNTNSHWGVFSDFAVARLTPDGQLDRTFADGEGLVAADSDDIDIARRMAVAPSGLIAIAGEDYDEDTYVSVFDANGSWGDVGFFGYPGDANDVAFRPDGKLVVVGNVERFEPETNRRVADTRIACFDPLAPLAGNDWHAQVQLPDVYADDLPMGVAVAPDGDVLVAGTPGLVRFDGGGLDAPTIANLYAGSTAWRAPFRRALDSVRFFEDFGVPLSLDPLWDRPLPWVNVDQVAVRFNRPVQVGLEDLQVLGVRGSYPVTAFSYDPASGVAIWTLGRTIGADRVALHLDDNVLGGRGRELGFSVLPGDVNGDGRVVADDLSAIRSRFFTTPQAPGRWPNQYDFRYDLDGSGAVLADDFAEAKRRLFQTAPAVRPVLDLSTPSPLPARGQG